MTKRKSLADATQSQDQPHGFQPDAPLADALTVEMTESIVAGRPDLITRQFRFADLNFPADQFSGTLAEAVEAGWQVSPDAIEPLAELAVGESYEYDSPDGKRIKVEAL